MERTPPRKIVHIDMDAFFASVEQRDDSTLRGRPVAVRYPADRGVVTAASYEARKYGIRSAMALVTALRRCPELVFVPPRFDVYRAVSREIDTIFNDYTPLVEPLSLDEASRRYRESARPAYGVIDLPGFGPGSVSIPASPRPLAFRTINSSPSLPRVTASPTASLR
jgi:hypothetical protein